MSSYVPGDGLEVHASGTCVKLFHDRKSWDDARDSCKAREGDLVKVVDFGMNKLIMGKGQS